MLDSGESPWEQRVTALLRDAAPSESARAQALLTLLPQLPEELLQEATQSAVDRLRDEDYAASALPLVLDAKTHGMAASVLFADLMERPDGIAFPALLTIAQTPDHPFAPAAHANLELLLGHNFAEDWQAWSAEVQRRLSAPQRQQ
jgi:hypothetical protein